MTSENSSIGRKSEASESRYVATAYIPSGKTRLQYVGAYASG